MNNKTSDIQKRGRWIANSRAVGQHRLGKKVPKAQKLMIDGIVCWLPSSQIIATQDHSVPSAEGIYYSIMIPNWLWLSKKIKGE